ncbi:MAG: hypothetical protein EA402_09990 [Planctomycetota bacterium]|nr:MAG: hypothetical protein EA402_09990 [Planctomycetota bacterium]
MPTHTYCLAILTWWVLSLACPIPGHADEPSDAARVEEAIAAGLLFLHRHQDAEGGWRVLTAPLACPLDGPKIAPAQEYADFRADVVVTAIALRCFLRAGVDRNHQVYGRTLSRAADWFFEQGPQVVSQKHLFIISAWLETAAMLEGRVPESQIDASMRQIQDKIVRDPKSGQALGWFYELTPARMVDLPATAWTLRALQAWPNHAIAKSLLEELSQAPDYLWYPEADLQGMPHRISIRDDQLVRFPQRSEGYGLSLMRSLGVTTDEPRLLTLRNGVLDAADWVVPKFRIDEEGRFSPFAMHSTVHGLAAHRDAPQLTAWAQRLRKAILSSQRRTDGCPHGSWGVDPLLPFRGSGIGDLLSTVLVLETLQSIADWEIP